jgi:hypothetical protein|tara:strand:- start:98 stop:565 length:468 start_codon:yes stop_codon:yes gene_type:complete
VSAFSLRLMEHRDAPLVAKLLSIYLSASKYANRALSAEKLPMTIFNVIELDQNLGLVVDDNSGVGRGAFLGGLFSNPLFDGDDALEYGFALDPEMRQHTREATKAVIRAFEDWAREKGAMEVKYTIGSGIPGKTLESIFDETGYERFGYCARKEM